MPQPSPSFNFVPLRNDDLPMLHEWLLRPHVAEWWGPAESISELRDNYIICAEEPNATRAYIAYLGTSPIGFLQAYVVMGAGGGWWEQETDPGARGTDQFLAEPSQLGKGIGSSMIRAFLEQLFADRTVTVVQTDPAPTNLRAIRAYRKAGFQEVGLVHTPDGQAMLMRCARQALTQASQNAA